LPRSGYWRPHPDRRAAYRAERTRQRYGKAS
jgi:hypothetical protein